MQEILRKDSRIVPVQRAVHDVHGDTVEHLEEGDRGGARCARSWILEVTRNRNIRNVSIDGRVMEKEEKKRTCVATTHCVYRQGPRS